jgi:hypothetical protein
MRKRALKLSPGEILVRFRPAIDSRGYTLDTRDELSAAVHASLSEGLPEEQRPLPVGTS